MKVVTGEAIRNAYFDREQRQMNEEAQRLFGAEARRGALPRIQAIAKAKIDKRRRIEPLITAGISLAMFAYYTTTSGVSSGLIAGTLTALATHTIISKALDAAQKKLENSMQVTVTAVYPR